MLQVEKSQVVNSFYDMQEDREQEFVWLLEDIQYYGNGPWESGL